MNSHKKLLTTLCVLLVMIIGVVGLVRRYDNKKGEVIINLRLQWVPQTQFAGYIVAKEKGFYKAEGLEVVINPAGPDLKPQVTVANGSDQFGIGVPNQVIAARTNGVPLVAIAQIFQDSPNRYVLKIQNKIKDLSELKGKRVGLWIGGDEAEFLSMLATAGMNINDIVLIPQEFSITPFLTDNYVLSMVTIYNELNLIEKAGYGKNKLQVISPSDYNSAILGDMIFTTEDFIKSNPEITYKFLYSSIKGWKYVLGHPEEALDIIMKYNPELNREEQKYMLDACLSLIKSNDGLAKGIGFINEKSYQNIQRILMESHQIDRSININEAINNSIWNKIPDSIKQID